ncbi:hypothetical protein [Agrobacterium sp.]|uniref:hypothetical protein n=1 Tax=Agrobacterium sp. TaxID=361 RepID=UPI00289B45C8|nr:hypothetical protein [Agrobacterium sp.]
MLIFFVVRFFIFAALISVMAFLGSGHGSIISGGLVFNAAYYSLTGLILYSIVLFAASAAISLFSSSNRFSLDFYNVLLADAVFSYVIILISSWFFLTENESSVSIGRHQGELVVSGLKTVLGWRVASESAKGAIYLAIVLHFLFFIHNYIATRTALKGSRKL